MFKLLNLSFITTYKCTAACDHCCFKCSPQRVEMLNYDDIARCLEQAKEIPSITVVIFTGGECFLLGDDLLESIRKATDMGYITRCVSNAYWAVDDEVCKEKIGEVKRAGLKEINFSVGDHHAKYIPIDNVVRAAREACKANLTTVVNIELEKNSTLKPTLRKIFRNLKKQYSKLIVNYGLWIPNEGKTKITHDKKYSLCNQSAKIGCKTILNTLSITPDGNVVTCCGMYINRIPELTLGNLKRNTIAQIVDSQSDDFLKLWLSEEGPYEILRCASEYDNDITMSKDYVHPCQACLKLYNAKSLRGAVRKACEDNVFRIYDKILTRKMFNECING